jgi:hypothetical protein
MYVTLSGVGVGGGLGVGGDGGAGKPQIWQVEQLSHRPQLAQEQFRELPAPPAHTQYGGFSVKQDGAPPVTRPLPELSVLVSVEPLGCRVSAVLAASIK